MPEISTISFTFLLSALLDPAMRSPIDQSCHLPSLAQLLAEEQKLALCTPACQPALLK
jgi:hypothetical protein